MLSPPRSLPARAQTAAGEITGVVRDQAGAAVPGATITVTALRTNLQRVIVSTEEGVYTAASLAPGEYRLDIELAGFKPVRREGVFLATGEKARIDFELEVGTLQEQVTVVGDGPVLRAETASLGTVVEHEQVVQLPLNGRLFVMLATIAPGVALPPNSVLPRINGGRPRTNEYLFDGISVLQPEPGQVAYYPIVDAIQEFKIESNSPPAEFGRFNGGVVNLTTKSGGNDVHGNLFEFFRNEHLNATNYFQRANPTKPEYRRNQYRRHARRSGREERHVLLRGLSGTASAHRPTHHIDRADPAAAARHLHRADCRARAGHLRSDHHRRFEPIAVPRQHDSQERDGSGLPFPPGPLSAADLVRHREQLQPDRERNQRSGPGRRASRSPVPSRPRPGVRAPDVLPRSRRASHRVSGRRRRHSCRQHRHRPPGHESRGRLPRTINTRSRTASSTRCGLGTRVAASNERRRSCRDRQARR